MIAKPASMAVLLSPGVSFAGDVRRIYCIIRGI